MPVIKEYREFFLRHVQVPSGAKADQESGFPLQYLITGVGQKYNRFLKGDFPSESVNKKLFESLTFKLNVEDTANSTVQGLVRIATDAEAEARTDNNVGTFTNVVTPRQLPDVVLALETGDAVVGTPTELAGLKLSVLKQTVAGKFKRRFKIEANVDKSIEIDATTKKIQLVNDTATPGNDMFYGTSNAGVKGWRSISAYVAGIAAALIPGYTFTKSVKLSTLNIELDGDAATPGASKFYGTNSGGTKGWYAQAVETIISYITLPGVSTRYLEINNATVNDLGFMTKYPVINRVTLIGFWLGADTIVHFRMKNYDDSVLEEISYTSGSGYFRLNLSIPSTHDSKFVKFEVEVEDTNTVVFYGIECSKV